MPELRFGLFGFDTESGRLERNGREVPLQEKPAALLNLLLSRPGTLITRDEIAAALWPETHVSYNDNLNTAINKLRQALGDTAANPRFVQTVPRRGYRFTAPVQDPRVRPDRDHRTAHPGAVQAYQQGRFHLNRLTDRSRGLARQYFQQAVDLDPECHLGHAGLVEALVWDAGLTGDGRAVAEAVDLALERARACAPDAVETVVAEAIARFLVHWDYPAAERTFARAREMGANELSAVGWHAAFMLACCRFEEALAIIEEALALDPLSPTTNLQKGLALYFAGARDEADRQLRRLLEHIDPSDASAQWIMFHHCDVGGDEARALDHLQKALVGWGLPFETVNILADAHQAGGMTAVRRHLVEVLAQSTGMAFQTAILHGQLGELDRAYAILDRAVARRDWNLCYLAADPRAAALRSDPRFAGILQRLHTGYRRS